jgi:hypothetical protein
VAVCVTDHNLQFAVDLACNLVMRGHVQQQSRM